MASGSAPRAMRKSGEEQERHAGALPQNQGKRLRIGRCEQARAKDEDEKSRKTGKKSWHWTRVLAELLEKLHRGGTLGRRAMILQRLAAAGGVDRDRRQQLAQAAAPSPHRNGNRRRASAGRSP